MTIQSWEESVGQIPTPLKPHQLHQPPIIISSPMTQFHHSITIPCRDTKTLGMLDLGWCHQDFFEVWTPSSYLFKLPEALAAENMLPQKIKYQPDCLEFLEREATYAVMKQLQVFNTVIQWEHINFHVNVDSKSPNL